MKFKNFIKQDNSYSSYIIKVFDDSDKLIIAIYDSKMKELVKEDVSCICYFNWDNYLFLFKEEKK